MNRPLAIAIQLSVLAAVSQTTPAVAQSEVDREADMFGETPVADREAAMFGEAETSSVAVQTSTAAVQTSTLTPQSRDDAMFDEPTTDPKAEPGPSALDRVESLLAETDDILDIGGRLFLRFDWAPRRGEAATDAPFSSPNLVDLYFDARPNDRLRAYIRGRLRYDPTIDENPDGFTLQSQDKLQAQLDQLWLKFDVARSVFVTIGRQPIKWGSGRFWNPSDFINQQVRDPLAIFDQRLGVTLLKLHVPIESEGWNLYAIAALDDATSLEKIGGALRAEILIGQTEITASGFFAKDAPVRLAADVSSGVWLFDLRAEAAVQKGIDTPFYRLAGGADPFDNVEVVDREKDWIVQVVAGAEISLNYSDEDSVTVGVEYFFNDAGYRDPALYTFLAFNGQLNPLYVGRHYTGLYAVLFGPGSWNDTNFIFSGIANLSDRSFLARLDHSVRLLTYLDLNTFVAAHFGNRGELRYDFAIAPGAIAALPQGLSVPAPLFDLGFSLTLNW